MVRRQVQLTEEQEAQLRRASASTGKSIAALIREAVDRAFGEESDAQALRRAQALAAIGKHRSRGGEPLGRDHDRYLAEDFGR